MIWILFGGCVLIGAFVCYFMVKLNSTMTQRMFELTQIIQATQQSIAGQLGASTEVFGDVKEQLGKLEKTNQRIVEISKDISSLQELLRAPKFRGKLGETLLENMLSQILPSEFFQLQFRFRSQEAVDAVVKLGGRLVSIDAKFSLENFRKYMEMPEGDERVSARKRFIQDAKNRCEEIASKYILPDENTFEFALMYIPAENVYYETIMTESLMEFFISKRVIPVSPNTLYAYLQVICFGLRGLQIEENAKIILKSISGLSVDLQKFKDDFATVGSHLSNACAKYDEGKKKLDRFGDKFQSLQEIKES